jgi:hypothetical protein
MQHRNVRGRAVIAVIVMATLALAGWASPGAAAGPRLKADYRFQLSFASSVAGGRHLDPVPVGATVFTTEKVKGRRVLTHLFNEGEGVDLEAASAVIPRRAYSIVVLMRFDEVSSYRRIIDFSNQGSDTGLYVDEGLLRMYDYDSPAGQDAAIAPNRWVQVVLTRSSSGRLKGFVDGVRQFSIDDADAKLGVISSADHLSFFRDNGSEMSGGAVARIRLYDGPLTDVQVARLSTTAPAPSVSTSVSSASRSTKVTVSGKNFGPREYVSVTLKDSDGRSRSLATVKTSASGAFSTRVTIPGGARRGAGSIIAEAGWSGLRAKVRFTVR